VRIRERLLAVTGLVALAAATPALAGTAYVNGLGVIAIGDEEIAGGLERFGCTARPGTGLVTVHGIPLERISMRKMDQEMRDSIAAGHAYLRASSARFGRDLDASHYDLDYDIDIETHNNAGPSGGLAFCTVTYAAMTDTPIAQDVCMTGAISASGAAQAIGGVDFKATGAWQKGQTWMIVPAENDLDVATLPAQLRGSLHICQVDTMDEVLFYALGERGPNGALFATAMKHYRAGRQAFQVERWKQAQTEFNAAIQIIPTDSCVAYWRSVAESNAEAPPRPRRMDAAQAALRRGDLETAWRLVNDAYLQAPDNREIGALRTQIGARRSRVIGTAVMQKVRAAEARGDWPRAETLLQQAIARTPEELAFARELEKVQGRRQAAPLEARLKRTPTDAAVLRQLARTYANYNLPAQALPLFARLEAAGKLTPTDLAYRALALRLAGRTDDATAVAKAAHAADPANRLANEQLRALGVDIIPPILRVDLTDGAVLGDAAGLQVEASDNIGVARWEALLGDRVVAASRRSTGGVTSLDLSRVPDGPGELVVHAYDAAGNVASRRVRVIVKHDG
jgi:tetratricopeptide (TPR) repeat protein